MNISLAWLRAIAPSVDPDPEEVCTRLAERGAPVDGVKALAEGFGGIVVGRVTDVARHPDADRLSLCRVEVGAREEAQVVCGAPNVAAGLCYPFAPVGSVLPDGARIEEVRIRGQLSEGMLCSAKELGMETDHSGLLELAEGLEPGGSIVEALELDDWRLDVEITANRGDLLSHVGVAREVAPGGVAAVTLPPIPGAPEVDVTLKADDAAVSAGGATIRIEDPDLCSRYLGAVVRGVTVAASPSWLQNRLRAAGARPINNVVDATNYVLLELGQPLHAFDLTRLTDATIVVRRARESEGRFKTLDGEERRLSSDMLMICDAERPVAVAGVMGGLDSEVGEETRDILLECALFDPPSIRSTRRALDLSTDASYRFERGVDATGMETALRRALELILATAGGELETQVADCHPGRFAELEVDLRPERVEHVLGVPFSREEIRGLLEPLGFELRTAGDGPLRVAVPGWRCSDVTREVDFIEEIARVRGYDSFPDDLGAFRPGTVPDHPLFQLEDQLRTAMAWQGFYEAQTPAFVPSQEGEVKVLNPVSKEEGYLRRDVLPSLLRRVQYNWAHGTRDVRLFELATSFECADEGQPPVETPRMAAVMTGRRVPAHWTGEDEPLDVWDLKGLVAALVHDVHGDAELRPVGRAEGVFARGFEALDRDGTVVCRAGEVGVDHVDGPPWADPVWGLELNLPAEPVPPPTPEFVPLFPFPGVERDLALLVPQLVESARVHATIWAAGPELLRTVTLFDRYEGEGVPDGMRSLAYRLRFASRERTLTDQEVDRALAEIESHLREELGVEARS